MAVELQEGGLYGMDGLGGARISHLHALSKQRLHFSHTHAGQWAGQSQQQNEDSLVWGGLTSTEAQSTHETAVEGIEHGLAER